MNQASLFPDDGGRRKRRKEAPRPFDSELGEALKEEAIARVGRGIDPEWYWRAIQAALAASQVCHEVTTDDYWERVGWEPESDHRGMATIVRFARDRGWIQIIRGKMVQSRRPGCHRRPIQVWRSLIWRPERAEVPMHERPEAPKRRRKRAQ